jgi:hypothetical protein
LIWQDGATSLIIAAAQSKQITEPKQVTETIMVPQQVTRTIESLPEIGKEQKQVTETIMVPQQVTRTIQVPKHVGHEAMVRLLLEHKANPNAAMQVCINMTKTCVCSLLFNDLRDQCCSQEMKVT